MSLTKTVIYSYKGEGLTYIDLREIVTGGVVDWTQLAQDRDQWRPTVTAVMNLRVIVPWT
jgi:hypothetical protein